eukprot:GHVS01013262.1.p1 GENE.GHVS01013262.1~~GHVS01013262.1.p1  ORF type:complete len:258 (-),score=22.85 GHVS01013262.1:195-968(-)
MHTLKDVAPNARLTLLTDDRQLVQAELVGRHTETDVAVVRVNGLPRLPPMELSESPQPPRQGHVVVTYGATEHGDEPVGVVGTVSQPRQTFSSLSAEQPVRYIQLALITVAGMSGSPVCDVDGRVVGMVVKKFHEYGLALPIRQVLRVARAIESNGASWTRPSLGLSLRTHSALSPPIGGVLIDYVSTGSMAEKAGLKYSDLIVEVNGVTVDSHHDVCELLPFETGETVVFGIVRNGGKHVMQIEVGNCNANGGKSR